MSVSASVMIMIIIIITCYGYAVGIVSNRRMLYNKYNDKSAPLSGLTLVRGIIADIYIIREI